MCMRAGLWAVVVSAGGWLTGWQDAGGQDKSTPIIRTMPPAGLMGLVTPRPTVQPWDWRRIEQQFEVIRRQRKEWNKSYQQLDDLYGFLASPAATGSQDMAEHLKRLAQWRAEMPDSYSALVITARAYITYAWEARTNKVAVMVTEEGWKLFNERTAEAHRLLDKAVEVGAKDGEVYRSYLNLSYAESHSKEETREWLLAGIKLDPTYYSMYTQLGTYLMPRWSGEPGDVERFAEDITKMLPGENGLEAAGLIAFSNLRYETAYGDTIYHGEYNPELLVRAAEVLVKRHPDAPVLTHFAALCARVTQDHAAAQRILPRLGPYDDEKSFVWLVKNEYDDFRTWAAATDIPRGEQASVWSATGGAVGMSFGTDNDHVWCALQFGRAGAKLLNVHTGNIELSLPSPQRVVNEFAFDPKRNLLAFSVWEGPQVGWTLWDLANGADSTFHATKAKCDGLAIHPKLPQIFWSEGKTVRSWDVAADAPGLETSFPGHIHGLMISADGSLFGISHGSKYLICDSTTGAVKYELSPPEKQPVIHVRQLLSIDEERRTWATISTAGKSTVSLVRFAGDGKTHEKLLEDGAWATACLSPDRKLLATVGQIQNGAHATPIEMWSLDLKKPVKRFDGHWNSIQHLAFSPDGSKLASMAMRSDFIKIWPLDDIAGE
jgi:hypothetical protein